MSYKHKILIVGIAGILTMPVQGETLKEVFQMALASDPEYKAAAASRDAVYAGKDATNANFYPGLNFSYYNSKTKTGTSETTTSEYDTGGSLTGTTKREIPSTDRDSSGYSFSISQSIYNRRNFVLSDQADIDVAKADVDFAIAKQQLIIKVAERYFDVLSAMDNMTFSEAEKKAVARQLDQTKQRFDVGLVAITDVHEAQAQYDQSVAQGILAENTLAAARESLRALTGQYLQNLAALSKESPLLSPSPDDIDTWTSMAMNQNLDILSAQHEVDRQRESLDLARANNYPTLDLSITHSISDDTHTNTSYTTSGSTVTTSDTPDTTFIGLTLNYNIYNGGQDRANTKKAQYILTAAKEQLEARRRSVQNLVRNAYLTVMSTISRVKALQQSVISNQSALKASEAGFEVGTRTTVDVLQARRQLFSAKNEHSNARYDYIQSRLILKQAAGSLSIADLDEINRWLDL